MLLVGQKELGGGFVRLAFTVNGRRMRVGSRLTADEIASFSNGRRLIETGHIAVYPPAPKEGEGPDRYVIHIGGGRYDVIAGVKLNAQPVTKDEADALAVRPS